MFSPLVYSSADNVLLQLLLEFIDIPKRRPIDSLLHDTANIVSKRTKARVVGGHRSGAMKFIDFFLFQRTFRLFCFSQLVQEQTLCDVGTRTVV